MTARAANALRRFQELIEEIDAKLRDAKSLAPFDGVITKKFIEVGDTVQPGQPLIDFSESAALIVASRSKDRWTRQREKARRFRDWSDFSFPKSTKAVAA